MAQFYLIAQLINRLWGPLIKLRNIIVNTLNGQFNWPCICYIDDLHNCIKWIKLCFIFYCASFLNWTNNQALIKERYGEIGYFPLNLIFTMRDSLVNIYRYYIYHILRNHICLRFSSILFIVFLFLLIYIQPKTLWKCTVYFQQRKIKPARSIKHRNKQTNRNTHIQIHKKLIFSLNLKFILVSHKHKQQNKKPATLVWVAMNSVRFPI